MKSCLKCGEELSDTQKFCSKCGFAATQPPIPPDKGSANIPLWIGSGIIVVIVICASIFLLQSILDKPSQLEDVTTEIGNEVDEQQAAIEPPPAESLPAEPLPVGTLSVTGIDTSEYPILTIEVEATELDTLSLANTLVYDGLFNLPISYIQQKELTDTASKYTIQIATIEPESMYETQTVKIAVGDIEAELSYEIPYDREEINFAIHQIDTSNYPEISVYFTIQDRGGEYIVVEEQKFFNLLDNTGGESATEIIKSFRTMKESGGINIAMVLDRSGSMDENGNFYAAQNMASYFLDLLNYSKGDSAAVISFDDYVYIDQLFSSDVADLKNAVRNMYTSGMTALYDALHVALLETSGQNGSQCIIALTDGLDNSSIISPYTVIDRAREFGIPIYIIGLGNENFDESRMIAEESGGYFTHINSISEIKAIYDSLLQAQQSQMAISYVAADLSDAPDIQDIRLQFKDRNYIGDVSAQFQYQNIVNPNFSQNALSVNIGNMNDIEKAIYYYEHQFVKAVNSYDFDDLKAFIDPNGDLYETQKNLIANYKKRNVRARLLYYKIDSMRDLGNRSHEVVVTEQFYIQIGDGQASYKEFVNTYIVCDTASGYKVSELTDLQTINERSIDIFIP